MPPQAPVWPSAPRERVRCPDHTGRRMVRGRPTGQLWTPLVQPTQGTECGAETLTDTVPPARLPCPQPAPGSSFSECRAPSWGPESPLTLDAPLAQTRSCWRELGSSLTGPRATGDPPKGTMAVMSPWVARGLWGEGRPGARRVPLASPQPHRSHTKTPTPLLPLPAECQNHTQAPSVHLLPPTPQGLWLLDKAEFTCLATGEAPLDACFSWEVNGQPHGGALEEGPTWHMNSSWSQSSRLALPRSLWASGSNVTCTLSGPCLRSPVTLMAQREHAASVPGNLTLRTVTAPGPFSHAWLLCEVSGFSPVDILLTWLESQQEVEPSQFATAHTTAQAGRASSHTWSVLRVSSPLDHAGATYTCVVSHEASRTLLNGSCSLDTETGLAWCALKATQGARGAAAACPHPPPPCAPQQAPRPHPCPTHPVGPPSLDPA
uniref:Ig-like domain-containing protein n=1 Tax=Bos indicus x Bos taurus TaxID=30522 RepID=A0A4W2DQL0_BOBOX